MPERYIAIGNWEVSLSIKRDAIAAKFNLQAILINGLGVTTPFVAMHSHTGTNDLRNFAFVEDGFDHGTGFLIAKFAMGHEGSDGLGLRAA